ncbi:MAG: hypothetical protein OEQ53_03265 [Saprospiraceae bacterium]|nr:hypothetical protein [Saprospiraceae bacterium]
MKPVIKKDSKRALIIGVEGFVGQNLIENLSHHRRYESVRVFAQQKWNTAGDHIEVVEQTLDRIDKDLLEGDDLFCCFDASFFNAGGKYELDKKHYKFIPILSNAAHRNGVSQLVFLSTKAAHPDALLFSNRVRGIIEQSVRKIGFWSIHIFRPSLLIGESSEKTWGSKGAELIGGRIDNLTGGWLKRNRPIEASVVASAMLEAATRIEEGVHEYSSTWLQDYASARQTKDLTKK